MNVILRPDTTLTSDDDRWTALACRDRAYDGRFVYSVRTTGVYCRPSCPARPARRENVAFHASPAAAEAAAFGPACAAVPTATASTSGTRR